MAAMFNTIAPYYDFVNKIGSLGFDGYWRRTLVRSLKKCNPHHVLDIACGTGVLSWLIYRKLRVEVSGLDISTEMLRLAEMKKRRYKRNGCKEPQYIEGAAEQLPFPDQSYEAVTVAFGVRNFENRPKALQHIYRVLKEEGHLYILDFATPRNRVWKALFHLYFAHILPLLGSIVSGNKSAYRYLPMSVSLFPQYQEFCAELSEAGFSGVGFRPLTGGVAVLYTGIRPPLKVAY